MKLFVTRALVAVSLATGLSVLATAPAQAQDAGKTRAQVKMDRDAFLSMARWDETFQTWVLRDEFKMPEGVASRDEVKSMREKFLSTHRYEQGTSSFIPLKQPRDMSKLTRAQVKMESEKFHSMYRYEQETSSFIPKK